MTKLPVHLATIRICGFSSELEIKVRTKGNISRRLREKTLREVAYTGTFNCVLLRLRKSRADGIASLNRADFLDQLIKKLPPSLAHFNHRASHYVPHSSGVTLHFTNPSLAPAEADILICSDGIKSGLRANLYERKGLDLRAQKARYSEWIAWRGLIKKSQFTEAFGEQASDKMMHCGRGRHILVSASLDTFLSSSVGTDETHKIQHFPVRNGELINIVSYSFLTLSRRFSFDLFLTI